MQPFPSLPYPRRARHGLRPGWRPAVAALNWRVDPLNVYRLSAAPYYSEQARYRNPGLARHADYDAVILGTSVSLGFDRPHTNERLRRAGAQSRDAGRLRTRAGAAARRGPCAAGGSGAWSGILTTNSFVDRPAGCRITTAPFPCISTTRPVERGAALPPELGRDQAQRPTGSPATDAPAISTPSPTCTRRARPAWPACAPLTITRARVPSSSRPSPRNSPRPLTAASFDANCLALVRAHPEVQFDLYFPAFSIAYHAIRPRSRPVAFDSMLAWKEDIARKIAFVPQRPPPRFPGPLRDRPRFHPLHRHRPTATPAPTISSSMPRHRRTTVPPPIPSPRPPIPPHPSHPRLGLALRAALEDCPPRISIGSPALNFLITKKSDSCLSLFVAQAG